MRVYKPATTKPIPPDARYSTRKGERYVTAVVNGKKVTGKVTTNGTMSIEAPCYSLKFKDNKDIVRYLRAYTNKKASEDLGRTIKSLMEPGADPALAETLPAQTRRKLAEWGIIDGKRAVSGRTLSEFIDEYGIWLRNTRVKRHGLLRCPKYCDLAISMIHRVADACQFHQWSDISKAALERYLSGLPVKNRTHNNYVVAFKGFCKWVVKNDLAYRNPVADCESIGGGEDNQKRRALSPDEFSRLLQTTQQGEIHHHLTGAERAVMYLLAAETGLRKKELLSLTVSCFDLDTGTVNVERQTTKNRHRAELPLKRQRIAQLKSFLHGKLPNVKVFGVMQSLRTGDMMKKDLRDAGLPFETNEGVCVFHCLRHVYSTNLSRTNATWYEHKVMMRHSLKGDVTAHYTKVTMERKRQIVEQLPNFNWPIQAMKAAG